VADRVPLDFDPPASQLRSLLLGLDVHELGNPTPCGDWTVATLLVHIMHFSRAFTLGARKVVGPATSSPPPVPDPADLPAHWRSRLPVLSEDLATAWRDPVAWSGTSQVGGATMPAAMIGAFGMNELVVHSWDLARSTGQDFAADPRILEPLIELLSQSPAEGSPGMFGPRVEIEDEAALLDQVVALAGRDPRWRPASTPR
jgi:uncharacterized protein (TIGR03086 family)